MLHEKYRPTEFDQFIGQVKAVTRIKAILGLPSFTGGAFLLHGPSGSGKTSLATPARGPAVLPWATVWPVRSPG